MVEITVIDEHGMWRGVVENTPANRKMLRKKGYRGLTKHSTLASKQYLRRSRHLR